HRKPEGDELRIQVGQPGLDAVGHRTTVEECEQVRQAPASYVVRPHPPVTDVDSWRLLRDPAHQRRSKQRGGIRAFAETSCVAITVPHQCPRATDVPKETPGRGGRTDRVVAEGPQRVRGEELVVSAQHLVRALTIQEHDDTIPPRRLRHLPLAVQARRRDWGLLVPGDAIPLGPESGTVDLDAVPPGAHSMCEALSGLRLVDGGSVRGNGVAVV